MKAQPARRSRPFSLALFPAAFLAAVSFPAAAGAQAGPVTTEPYDTRPLVLATEEAKEELTRSGYFLPKMRAKSGKLSGLGPQSLSDHQCNHITSMSCPSDTRGGELTTADCRLTDGSYVDIYSFQGTAGQTVTITMTSTPFDAFLFLLNPSNTVVATNDDFGGTLNSQIIFTLNATGLWSIAANSVFASQFGAYTLSLSCTGTAPPPTGSCTVNSTTLCLSAARFRVQVSWRAVRQGTSGVGTAIGLTADNGYFWFFNSANIELVLKVLDARVINGRFWVFYGALSDVEYTITVTDTVTGAVKTYFNPQDRLASVADTLAFQ